MLWQFEKLNDEISAIECGTKLFFALISFGFAFLQLAEANRQIEIAT